MAPVGSDEYGVFWEVDAKLDGDLHFVVHQGDAKVEAQNLCPRTPLYFLNSKPSNLGIVRVWKTVHEGIFVIDPPGALF